MIGRRDAGQGGQRENYRIEFLVAPQTRGAACRSASKSGSSAGRHTLHALMACAVRSVALRSKGNVPHPRQNVGMPPSLFRRSSNH